MRIVKSVSVIKQPRNPSVTLIFTNILSLGSQDRHLNLGPHKCDAGALTTRPRPRHSDTATAWRLSAVKGFWVLWNNIMTVATVMFLNESFDLYTLPESNAVKQNTLHSPMAYYVHVLIYNADRSLYVKLFIFSN
jgi:hypothetical protein